MKHTTSHRQAGIPALSMRLAAACRDPRQHRALVLAVNAGLVACAAAEPFTVTLMLHLVLLPINAWRLLDALRFGASARDAGRPFAASGLSADVASTRQKAQSMRCPALKAAVTMQTVRLSPRATL